MFSLDQTTVQRNLHELILTEITVALRKSGEKKKIASSVLLGQIKVPALTVT